MLSTIQSNTDLADERDRLQRRIAEDRLRVQKINGELYRRWEQSRCIDLVDVPNAVRIDRDRLATILDVHDKSCTVSVDGAAIKIPFQYLASP